MASERIFTTLVLEDSPVEPYFQNYWADAAHLGEAIVRVYDAAKDNGMVAPYVTAADTCNITDVTVPVIPGKDAPVFWSESQYNFPPEPTFHMPFGITSSMREGKYSASDIVTEFAVTEDVDGLITIEVNVEDDRLFSTYTTLLRLVDQYRVFWYKIHGHWINSDEEVILVNEALSTTDQIVEHLQANYHNSVTNGFVTLTAYQMEGATNINISEHKQIVILTQSKARAEVYRNWLTGADFRENTSPLLSISSEIYHWHFRHPESRGRSELIEHLIVSGFREWKP